MSKRAEPHRPHLVIRVIGAIAVTAALLVIAVAVSIVALRFVPPPTSAFMLLSHFADPATGQPCDEVDQRWVPREEISPDLFLAIVMAEDQRFLQHNGIDFTEVRNALDERGRGRVRGASTLTQQLAKNLFLWPGQNLARKGMEAWIAITMELFLPKERILELYVNVAQFGACTFGAAAASEKFYGRSPSELSREQAALLAAALPSPAKIRADDPGPYAQERSQDILDLMAKHVSMRSRL